MNKQTLLCCLDWYCDECESLLLLNTL